MAYTAGNAKNVLVGAAAIFLSTEVGEETPLPTFVAGVSARDALSASPDWINVGFTNEGLELTYEPDFGEVTVDQTLSSVKMFKQGITMSANTTLAEATLKNLMIAWAIDDSAGAGLWHPGTARADDVLDLTSGQLGDVPTERTLVAIGQAPEGANGATAGERRRERIYVANRVISVESSSFGVKRTEATQFPVSFRLLPGGTDGTRFGQIRDRYVSTVAAG